MITPTSASDTRTNLVLDFIEFDDPINGGIPFLGFGEFSARGNRDRPIGYLRPSSNAHPSVLTFGARLWQAVPPTPISGGTQPATLASYVWLLANAPLGMVATYAYVNPVVAITLGVLFRGEDLTWRLLIGAVVVVFAVALVVRKEPDISPSEGEGAVVDGRRVHE